MISEQETFLSVVKQYEKPKININSLFRVLKVIVIILTINGTHPFKKAQVSFIDLLWQMK